MGRPLLLQPFRRPRGKEARPPLPSRQTTTSPAAWHASLHLARRRQAGGASHSPRSSQAPPLALGPCRTLLATSAARCHPRVRRLAATADRAVSRTPRWRSTSGHLSAVMRIAAPRLRMGLASLHRAQPLCPVAAPTAAPMRPSFHAHKAPCRCLRPAVRTSLIRAALLLRSIRPCSPSGCHHRARAALLPLGFRHQPWQLAATAPMAPTVPSIR